MLLDKFTPIQRFAAYARGEPLDRLPCVPIIGNTAARVIGVKVSQLRTDAALLAKAQIDSYRKFGYDVVRVFTDLYVIGEAMGAKIRIPDDETAYLETPVLHDIADSHKLRPVNPHRDGILPLQLEAMRRVAGEIGAEVPVTGALTCPFTNASFLIGAEALARLLLKNPEAVHKLCRISLESAIACADAIIETGCTPSLTDAMSSSTVISPRQFREFSLPYLKELINHIGSRGKKVTLHICGKTRLIWSDMADTGAVCLSLDNDADLAEARLAVGERVRLMGNVPTAAVMLQGTSEEVRQAVFTVASKAWDNPKGLIVASGCSLPTETPFANITAMMDAVRELSWPIRKELLS
ncbi:MAG: uroporphyrinogen decarboxylase family protein [Lentisphaerota bacterium]